MTDAELLTLVSKTMAASGYTRHRKTWYRVGEEVIVVLNLQKSQWGDGLVFINLGFWLRALGEPVALPPKENQCHVRTRADGPLFSIAREMYDSLNLRVEMPDDERSARVVELLRDKILPFLQRCSTLSGLAAAAQGESDLQIWVLKARPILGLKPV